MHDRPQKWFGIHGEERNFKIIKQESSVFYLPLQENNYKNSVPGSAEVEHLGHLAWRYDSRQEFLTKIFLDPTNKIGDLAEPPTQDEARLVLSIIHLSKGVEWDAVNLIYVSDGNLPAGLATGRPAEIAEELRLASMAMSRQGNICSFCGLWVKNSRLFGMSDYFNLAQFSRFIADDVIRAMECL